MPKELEQVYIIVSQIEGTVQTPLPFHLYISAEKRADKIAAELDRETDDVRVFEISLNPLKVSEVYVPSMGDK